jgi:hypothetical protein
MSEEFKERIKSLGKQLKDVCDTFGDKYTELYREAERLYNHDQTLNEDYAQLQDAFDYSTQVHKLYETYMASHGGYPKELYDILTQAHQQRQKEEQLLRDKRKSQADVQQMLKRPQDANDSSQEKRGRATSREPSQQPLRNSASVSGVPVGGRGSHRQRKHRAKHTKKHRPQSATHTRHR